MPTQERLPGRLGPYRLLDKLGEGGMGVVYLARDAENRPVAVKVLGPAVVGDPDARRRLVREVETMRRVRSPYVAEILDADVNSDSPYIVTRYVPGKTLDDVVRDTGPLRGPALERMATGLARALIAIHAAGVVHRDLKPGNVMMVEGNPVVIDFGIAQAAGSVTRLTMTGMVMGTPGYLAPEVIEGKPSSSASDVHSWGGTVAYAATGRTPYGGGSFQTVFYRIIAGQPDLTGVPVALLPLVAAALSSDPAGRPPASWLASQCAGLDMSAVAAPTVATGPDGTRIAANRAGAGPDGTRVAGYGGTQQRRAMSPAEAAAGVADLLPPADYSRNGYQGGQAAGPGQPGARPAQRNQEASRPTTGYGLLSAACMAAMVVLSTALPVAGTALSIAIITLLRAADSAQSSLALRRSARGGPRPADIVIVIVTAPLTVAGALLTSLLIAPLALVVAGAAAAASAIMLHNASLPEAGAWAAGAAVAWYCVGLGSRRPRRQLTRIFSSVLRTPAALGVAVVATWALAAAALVSATTQPPFYWPTLGSLIPHLPSLSGSLHSAQHWLRASTSGLPRLP